MRGALNYHLKPNPIAVPTVEIAMPDFHARFSATWRRYRYRILNRRSRPGLDAGFVWHVPVPLDVAAMADASGVDLDAFFTISDILNPAPPVVANINTEYWYRSNCLLYECLGRSFRGGIRVKY